ncbi:hypothetical protein [Falsiroseomonas sp. HW251]|uniref:hypothetical protein n=1 Tax=Falsiroseomonas sp. HW251 TaxID=3390998 RepID=UPI003D31CB5C
MDLILGACAGYPPHRIAHFAESLRRWYEGEVVFLTAALPPATQAMLSRHRITQLDIDVPPPLSDIQHRRYAAYADILRDRPAVRRVLMLDVRDVWFQADPFPMLPDAPLACFLEDQFIMHCGSNSAWIAARYGQARLAAIGGRPISCSGTVGGTREGVLRYLALMAREVGQSPPGMPRGVDQGIHNHLLAGEIEDAVLVPNRTGLVQTLHYQQVFAFDRQGRMVNADGRVCPVIHQFDRFPQFFPLLGISHGSFMA